MLRIYSKEVLLVMEFRLINGVDIIDIGRVDRIYSNHCERFINKIFTKDEIEYLDSKNFRIETIAGMFAGKEAISKALGTGIGKVGFKDMEILHTAEGKPFVRLSQELIKEFKLASMEISISHEKDYAVAFVVGTVL